MADRPDITMAPDEIRAFLATQTRVVVGALDAASPIGTVAAAHWDEDADALEVTLAADDPVRLALAADDRVCVIAEQFPAYSEIKGVCAHGHAEPVDGVGGRTFRVGIDDVTSFDFGKIPRAGAGSGTDSDRSARRSASCVPPGTRAWGAPARAPTAVP